MQRLRWIYPVPFNSSTPLGRKSMHVVVCFFYSMTIFLKLDIDLLTALQYFAMYWIGTPVLWYMVDRQILANWPYHWYFFSWQKQTGSVCLCVCLRTKSPSWQWWLTAPRGEAALWTAPWRSWWGGQNGPCINTTATLAPGVTSRERHQSFHTQSTEYNI